MLNKVASVSGALLVLVGALIGAAVVTFAGVPEALTSEELADLGFPTGDVFEIFEKRMMQQEKEFMDVLEGMHSPKLDMKNETDKYVLTLSLDFSTADADADGIQDAELEVAVQGSMLTVGYVHQEQSKFGSSSYAESTTISAVPRDVDADRATSSYDEEAKILTVTLPKLAKQPKKKVPLMLGKWAHLRGASP